MSKPAALSRSDLAITLLVRLFVIALVLVVTCFLVITEYVLSLSYGVMIFLLSNVVFSLYAFRYQGSQSSLMIMQAFGRGIFVKLLFFALSLVLVFRFDQRSLEYMQTAMIFFAYFFMQVCQIVLSIRLARRLDAPTNLD